MLSFFKRYGFVFFTRVFPCLLGLALLGTGGLYLLVLDDVELVSPDATFLFEDRYGRFITEGSEAELGFWDLPDPVPSRVVESLLSIEDKRYFDHGGVDFRALLRAFCNNVSGASRQGASTIAMQVARMQSPGGRTYFKKVREMMTAWLIVRKFGHGKVLEHYLKIVPQGNRIHGVSYAARRYFQKPVQDLGWAEAAVLASLPKTPGRMNLYRYRGKKLAFKRAALILDLLNEQGTLDEEAHGAAVRQLAQLEIPWKESRPYNCYHAIMRLQEMAGKARLSVGHPIRTGLDLAVQDYVEGAADSAIRRLRRSGAGNIAVVVAERESGRIVSYLGSAMYDDETYSGSMDYAVTPRSSGSILKPFIYALGLESGQFSPSDILADLPFHIVYPGGHYHVSNFDSDYLGPMLYGNALANSRNVPAVAVLKEVGTDKALSFFKQMNLERAGRSENWYGLGMAIGGIYVTLEDLVRGYGMLLNGGMDFSLSWFDGREQETPRRVLSEDAARQVTLFLSDPLARMPMFPRMGALEYPFPVAVKTGTSQGFRDAWCVAFSSKYITGAWVGHPDNEPMKQVGGIAAAGLVKDIMLHLHPEEKRGIHTEPFPLPRGSVPVRLCPISGHPVGPLCTSAAVEYMRPEAVPVSSCTSHKRFAVDRRTGREAKPDTPADEIEIRTCPVLPPEYASWSAGKGYSAQTVTHAGLAEARAEIQAPVSGSRIMINPEIPADFQTLALRVSVTPAIPEIQWLVDGKEYRTAPYPYTVRWPLKPGIHTFQARFPKAHVESSLVTVTVGE